MRSNLETRCISTTFLLHRYSLTLTCDEASVCLWTAKVNKYVLLESVLERATGPKLQILQQSCTYVRTPQTTTWSHEAFRDGS